MNTGAHGHQVRVVAAGDNVLGHWRAVGRIIIPMEEQMGSEEVPQLIRLATAAARLDTAPETLRYWIRTGKLTSVKIGRNVYLSVGEIQRLVADGRRKATGT